MATPESNAALLQLGAMRSELRGLRVNHDAAARTFEVNAGIGAVLLDLGLGWAEDNLGIPTETAREEADRLRLAWTESKPYRDLVGEFDLFLDRVRAEVSPMFRGRLALAAVYRAVNLATKIRQLDSFLLGSEDRIRAWVAAGRKLPVGRIVSRGPARKKPRAVSFWMPRTFSEWVALVSGTAALLSYALLAVSSFVSNAAFLLPLLLAGSLLFLLGIGLLIHRASKTASDRPG